jgi:hypothetical protein
MIVGRYEPEIGSSVIVALLVEVDACTTVPRIARGHIRGARPGDARVAPPATAALGELPCILPRTLVAGAGPRYHPAMGLGRITRFASTPAGSRRVNTMRAGRAGVKALAPPDDLFADFSREKSAARKRGASAEEAHAEAFGATRYRERFRQHILASPESREALRALVDEARTRDVYVMCMCPYRTAGEACHTYLLLGLAQELDPALPILPEPAPSRPAGRR